MSWISSSVRALQERELHAESLSLREVLRQPHLELPEKRFSLNGVVTEPREPSYCLNLVANPFLGRDNLALGPFPIGK
jgi:hypothetical protein